MNSTENASDSTSPTSRPMSSRTPLSSTAALTSPLVSGTFEHGRRWLARAGEDGE